jgi:hypothetical protein
MNENVISSAEAHDLFGKLISEHIRVTAAYLSATGAQALLSGFVDSVSARSGIVVSATQPISESERISVPLAGRNAEISYCDRRELPPGAESLATKVGDTVLLIRFLDDGETFFLTFTL